MRTMVDLGSQRGPIGLHIMDTATSVDCHEVRFRRTLLRSLIECMVPACCAYQPTLSDYSSSSSSTSSIDSSEFTSSFNSSTSTHASTVTGTFLGYRKGRVSFCLQDGTKNSPLLLLELGIPTSYLAKEMQYGLLRIALVECERRQSHVKQVNGSLFSVPLWSVFFNGRKIGYAKRRAATEGDVRVLKMMQSVSVGAGVLKDDNNKSIDEKMYMRAKFKRVSGSINSESFHMINPEGSSCCQELSIFLLRA
ncbi:protein MIZU-KUSSEI 1-like [Apium graveolens]|uniref:protein MIZU-KUSSEI 1-like n=1 Tax=Apium graveolens TaxID=4045 RepID=UPI003D7AA1AC